MHILIRTLDEIIIGKWEINASMGWPDSKTEWTLRDPADINFVFTQAGQATFITHSRERIGTYELIDSSLMIVLPPFDERLDRIVTKYSEDQIGLDVETTEGLLRQRFLRVKD